MRYIVAEYRNIHKFQFHIGAIRIGQKSANATILTTFQFHIGAIRISTVSHVPDLVGEFQFHIGAIRIYRDRRHNYIVFCFNSILVQLEFGYITEQPKNKFLFQFHIGAIRICIRSFLLALSWVRFNSILVQLEYETYSALFTWVISFNSILVQLESGFFSTKTAQGKVSIPYWCN